MRMPIAWPGVGGKDEAVVWGDVRADLEHDFGMRGERDAAWVPGARASPAPAPPGSYIRPDRPWPVPTSGSAADAPQCSPSRAATTFTPSPRRRHHEDSSHQPRRRLRVDVVRGRIRSGCVARRRSPRPPGGAVARSGTHHRGSAHHRGVRCEGLRSILRFGEPPALRRRAGHEGYALLPVRHRAGPRSGLRFTRSIRSSRSDVRGAGPQPHPRQRDAGNSLQRLRCRRAADREGGLGRLTPAGDPSVLLVFLAQPGKVAFNRIDPSRFA